MIIDAILLMIAIALVICGTVGYVVAIRPAIKRWDAEQRRLERDRDITRMQEELHLDR